MPRAASAHGSMGLRLSSTTRVVGPPHSRLLCTAGTEQPPPQQPSPSEGDVIWPLRHIADDMPEAMRAAFSRANMSQSELSQLEVQSVISRWQRAPRDTGSGEVQVAVFTARIQQLAEHMKRHHKDKNTKRRLIMLIAQRSKMLKYLRRKQRDRYTAVIEGLGIRPTRNFDPTLQQHQHGTTTSWAARGFNKYTPKRRRPRAVPYGEEKSAKGRAKMRRHAVRQRRLEKRRLLEAAEAARAERIAAQAASSPSQSA